ncbi:MAG: peptidylprolyl isomerase [Candidatus Saganbacteria bacterium]|nr:peptidylprolyl isomerase [Candidatus Saganbacteria bacterium]
MNKKILIAIIFIFVLSANILAAQKGNHKMYAVFETSMGNITCELYPEQAPLTVKNFAGLAKGEIKWIDPKTKESTERPLYDGTIFHRVIPDFMIQGGDPLGLGIGGPGYRFEDEIDPTLNFDKAGMLAMANSGPNTNGSQFFITVAPTPWLTGLHTIFGKVIKGQDIADKISVVSAVSDRPVKPVVLKKVTIK